VHPGRRAIRHRHVCATFATSGTDRYPALLTGTYSVIYRWDGFLQPINEAWIFVSPRDLAPASNVRTEPSPPVSAWRPSPLLVVTADHVYAFDASLLRWTKILRQLGEWSRDDLVARAVDVSGPVPPRWAEMRFRPPPGLRLENSAGLCLAEVRPLGWGDDAKEVFRLLTGSAGWPDAEGRA
jgi:hypothetical protein